MPHFYKTCLQSSDSTMQMVMHKQFWSYLWYSLSIMAVLLLVGVDGEGRKPVLCGFLFYFFFNIYVHDSVHRNSRLKKSNKMQQHADIYLLLNYSTCFRRPSHPSSGVHKTVVAASGTDHAIWGASFLKRDQKSPQIV